MTILLVKIYTVILLNVNIYLSKAEDIYKSSGTTVELKCPYTRGSSGTLTWSYVSPALPLVYSLNGNINPDLSSQLKQRISITGNHSAGEYHLTISKLEFSDTGTYECSSNVNNIDNQRLYVVDAPTSVRFDDIEDDILTGTEGQDLTIKCTAVGGNPEPNVTLHIPGLSAVPSSKRSVSHTLKTVNRSYDGRTVICKATNIPVVEQKNDSAKIYLNLKPLLPAFGTNPVSTEETVPLIVSCTSHGSRPAGNFQWILEHNNMDVTANSVQQPPVYNTSANTYTVTSKLKVSVDRTYHGTYVVCGVSNTATTTHVTNRKILDIKYAPDITVQNKTFQRSETPRQIQCVLNGNPVEYVFDKWQHRSMYGVLIQELEGTNTLTLPSVPINTSYQNTGEYICTANNGIKDKSGKIKQTGSGYVTVKDLPIFTTDNLAYQKQFGEFGQTGQIFVYVYSIPKYSTVKWYRGNTPLTVRSDKYISSDNDAAVNDTFHGIKVKLDGYKVTLTITELTQEDFDNYTLRLYSGSQYVEHMVMLESASAPQTPMNFSVDGSSESSITIKWIAGYNGGHKQTFYVEYREQGSMGWIQSEVPTVDSIQQSISLMYTVSGLKDGTVYDVRMFAKNKYNQSLPTDTETIQTLKASPVSTGAIIGGVAGGLVAIIVIMVILVLFVFKRRTETCTTRKKLRSESESEDIFKDNILSDSQHSEEEGLKDNILYQSAGSSTALAEGKKKKPSTSDSGAQESVVYAEVNKKTQQKNVKVPKQKVKKGKPKKAGGINTKALNNNPDGEYANAGLAMTNVDAGEYSNSPHNVGMGNKNAQGLEYADISFAKEIPSKGKKPVIHGIEDRTVYSDIDHTKKAPPPPQESEYEETNIKHDRRK